MRRKTDWLDIPYTLQSSAGTGGAILSSLNAAALAARPFTVVRTRIELYIISDQQAASEFQAGGFGMAVVSDQASAIGVTAVPTPVTDLSSDLWFVHQVMFNSFVFADATGVTQEGTRYVIDSKAMRKVNSDEDIVIVQEFSAVGSGFTVASAGRMLIKLH